MAYEVIHDRFFPLVPCMAHTCGSREWDGAEGMMPAVMPGMPAMPSGQWKLQMTFAVCQLGADGGSDGGKAEGGGGVRGGWTDHLERPPVHHLQSPGPYGSARLCPVEATRSGLASGVSAVSRPGLSGKKCPLPLSPYRPPAPPSSTPPHPFVCNVKGKQTPSLLQKMKCLHIVIFITVTTLIKDTSKTEHPFIDCSVGGYIA